MTEICWPCRRGHHGVCAGTMTDFQTCDCTHYSTPEQPLSEIGAAVADEMDNAEDWQKGEAALSEPYSDLGKTFKRKLKNDDAVTDQQSTGRKRAALLFPLRTDDGSPIPCEFAERYAVLPGYVEVNIDGCGIRKGTARGIAQARHHLNYDTLDNSPENVVRICHSCHNKLHAVNDPHKDKIYERIYGFKPKMSDLSHAAKALRSGIVSGGKIDVQAEEA